MRSFTLEITEKQFNLLWRSLAAREQELLGVVEKCQDDDDSEKGPLAANDLIYLRLYQKALKEQVEQAGFAQNAFSLSYEIIDLSKM